MAILQNSANSRASSIKSGLFTDWVVDTAYRVHCRVNDLFCLHCPCTVHETLGYIECSLNYDVCIRTTEFVELPVRSLVNLGRETLMGDGPCISAHELSRRYLSPTEAPRRWDEPSTTRTGPLSTRLVAQRPSTARLMSRSIRTWSLVRIRWSNIC